MVSDSAIFSCRFDLFTVGILYKYDCFKYYQEVSMCNLLFTALVHDTTGSARTQKSLLKNINYSAINLIIHIIAKKNTPEH